MKKCYGLFMAHPGRVWHAARKFLLLMKLTAILLLGFCIQGWAIRGYSQERINLNLKDVSIVEVFRSIEALTSYRFVYNEEVANNKSKVSVYSRNATLEYVMQQVLQNTSFSYKTFDRNLVSVIAGVTKLKTIPVTGKVLDDKGEPLPGVSVQEKGTNNGTVTNNNGSFLIDVKDGNAILVFSAVGYSTKEIAASAVQNSSITMTASDQQMDEVVVIAYGTEKKTALTAAVTQVSPQNIQKRPLRSLADGLQGLAAGLNINAPSGAPQASLNLNIRGFTGFNKATQPLILVDGVERDINDVNPNDVASISVLKDAAATAIYGSRAPYGIVLITTRIGKKNQKASITYSGSYRVSTIPNQPQHPDSWDFMEMINDAYFNNPLGNRNPFYSQKTIDRARALGNKDYTNPVFDGIDPQYVPYGVYPLDPAQWAAWDQAFANTDWFDVGLKKRTPSHQHDLAVSGGAEKSTYYVGLGYTKIMGAFKDINDHKDRYSLLAKYNVDIAPWLTTRLNTNYVRSNDIGPNVFGQGRNYATMWNTLARSYPWFPVTNPNGSPYRFNTIATVGGAGGSEGTKINDLTLTGEVVIKPAKGWDITGQYAWHTTNRDYALITIPVYQVLPNGQQAFTQRSATTSGLVRNKSNTDYYTVNLYSSYTRTFAQKHTIAALAGFQEEENKYSQIGANVSNLISLNTTTLGTSLKINNVTENMTNWASRGYFGRLNYNYDDKYILEFNARYDGNSRFNSPNAKEKWAFSPSVSGAWNLARENFWPLKSLVSQFKLRGSWANSANSTIDMNGNGSIDPYEYYLFSATLGQTTYTNLALDGAAASAVTAPTFIIPASLTWEKPRTIGAGADVTALRNRLNFSYDWYQRTTRDQAGRSTPLPEVLGLPEPVSNNTVSETRGWEFSVDWHDKALTLANKAFNYQLGFRISDYIGYVVSYKSDGTGLIGSDGRWIPGQRFGQNRFVQSNGIIQNEEQLKSIVPYTNVQIYTGDLSFQDLNGDGMIGVGDRWYNQGDAPYVNSYTYPRYRYGITLGADWNGFDLLVNMDGAMKREIYSNSQYIFGTNGNEFFSPYFRENMELGYWTPENAGAFFPRNTLHNKFRSIPNDQYAVNLAHLRIRSVRLGYNINPALLQKLHLKNLNIYVSGENLGFIYYKSYIKLDPELLGSTNTPGEEYPPARLYSFGLTIGL